MLCTLLAVLLPLIGYFICVKSFKYWSNRGVPQKDVLSLWIQLFNNLRQSEPPVEAFMRTYNGFPNKRYAGIYQVFYPSILVRDPELIKQITIKDFDHFMDHRPFLPPNTEPLWEKNLVSLNGDKWRDMRGTISPSFTSSKLKLMFRLLTECAEKFVKHFQIDDVQEVEMKDAFTKYTSDVIGSVAFGVNCDSLKNPNNEFYKMGLEASYFRGIKILLIFVFPTISKFLGLRFVSKKVSSFFTKLMKDNIEERETKGIVRMDLIHLLLEAKKGRLKDDESSNKDEGFATMEEDSFNSKRKPKKEEFTDEDIMAQAFIFFLAGFDGVSTAMSFLAYELALNPNIQERLQNEVDDALSACNGNITYDALLKMKYMDMVVTETLRKWPIAMMLDRMCIKPYTIKPAGDEKPLELQKGDHVIVSVIGMHRDPQYFPDPELFDPERFSDENKSNINKYSFLAFGVGPRGCIGNRFALLEIKVIIFYILSKFDFIVVEKTPIPMVIGMHPFNISSRDGFWLGLKPRRN